MVSDSVWLDAGDLGQTYPRPNQDGAGALPKVFRSLTWRPRALGLVLLWLGTWCRRTTRFLSASPAVREWTLNPCGVRVEPIPETVEALRELTRFGDETIARTLLGISRAVEQIAPEVVGVSLSMIEENLTFTMTATTGPVAQLDGMQYLAGGPCDDALRSGEPKVYRSDEAVEEAVDEDRWELFARATAAAGVASTLSLPMLRDGIVVAGVNLYGSTPDAFEGRHEEIARACGAWAGGAVKNADLDFSSRFRAAETPDRLRAQNQVDMAVGALMSRWDLPIEEAEERLSEAAKRAGISDDQMARAILGLFVDSPIDELEDDIE
jgi:GAF domain-containing protein